MALVSVEPTLAAASHSRIGSANFFKGVNESGLPGGVYPSYDVLTRTSVTLCNHLFLPIFLRTHVETLS